MRSDYILTKTEVYGYASAWLAALRLEYEGRKCTTCILLQILLIAAARVVSIFAACRDLADAPSDQTIRNALEATLPECDELERRLNGALVTELPRALLAKPRKVAIDLTLIPYHGQPLVDEKEIVRGAPKSGTTHFHAYASAVVLHHGHRYTLAVTRVERGDGMKEVLQKLLKLVRKRGIKVSILLLDKAFYSVDALTYLKRAQQPFIVPAVPRGRPPKGRRKAKGLRALLKEKHGFYEHTLTTGGRSNLRRTQLRICVVSKHFKHRKSGRKRRKPLLFAVWNVRLSPTEIRETYRKRFGIETSYRQMNQARIKTCTRDPAQRLLFVGLALVLRNVWVWLHFRLARQKWSARPQLFLELLRFKEMLLWITQQVQQLLHADEVSGIPIETYKSAIQRNA